MEDKFVVQDIETERWLNLDYHDGSDLLYVKNFLDAYAFKTAKEAKEFVINHGLKLESCELFKTRVFAQPLKWQ